jgi:predicted RNase H-like HicB family nuclease
MKKASSKTTRTKATPKVTRAEAARLAEQYSFILVKHPEGGFLGRSVEMPGVLGHGETEAECLEETRDAVVETILVTYELGEEPPRPASEGKRDVQFNLRLTADERVRIEQRARVAGFTSVADFIRRAALRYTG